MVNFTIIVLREIIHIILNIKILKNNIRAVYPIKFIPFIVFKQFLTSRFFKIIYITENIWIY